MNRDDFNKLFDDHFIDDCAEVYDAQNDIVEYAEKAVKLFAISDVMCSLPTDEFLTKHLYKTDALLKFGIMEMIHKKDLTQTQLIGVLEYLTNLR